MVARPLMSLEPLRHDAPGPPLHITLRLQLACPSLENGVYWREPLLVPNQVEAKGVAV